MCPGCCSQLGKGSWERPRQGPLDAAKCRPDTWDPEYLTPPRDLLGQASAACLALLLATACGRRCWQELQPGQSHATPLACQGLQWRALAGH